MSVSKIGASAGYDVMIVDSYALLFRGYFASVAMRDPVPNRLGQYTNGMQQVLRYLMDAVQTFKPKHICCAYDAGSKTFRNEKYEGYKSNRPQPPEALSPQFEALWEMTLEMGLPSYRMTGYEADDVIGTLTAKSAAAGLKTAILTGDGDALQLIDAYTDVILLKKGFGQYAVINSDNLPETKGIQRADQIIDLKALMGDASDQIPGCPKIGEKTALKLLAEFDSVQNLYAQIAEVPERWAKLLIEHREQVMLSKELATIHRAVPLIEAELVPFERVFSSSAEQIESALSKWALEKMGTPWQEYALIEWK